ncbi:hypothetical protein D3C74_403220 [compost metagenome]
MLLGLGVGEFNIHLTAVITGNGFPDPVDDGVHRRNPPLCGLISDLSQKWIWSLRSPAAFLILQAFSARASGQVVNQAEGEAAALSL